MTTQLEESTESREAQRQAAKEAREAAIAAAPYAVVHVDSSGIHPSTSRIIALTVLTLTPEGEVKDTFYQVFDSESDIGPRHLHGLMPEDIAGKPSFERTLRQVNSLLDGRTLVLHNMPRAWGFIYTESKLALRNAQKRNRGRSRNRRGRRRIGRVARPVALVDTLATARRLGLPLDDTRVRAVARELQIEAPDPKASVERALMSAEQVGLETAQLIAKIFWRTREDAATYDPATLKADRFGLQRSITRVDATDQVCAFDNPGTYEPGKPLQQGMEFVVSPDIQMNPDGLIAAGVEKGLSYAEKVTRQSSLVVCNETAVLRGKAMHADRKSIPLVEDAVFLELLENVAPAEPADRSATQRVSTNRQGNRPANKNNRGRSDKPKSRGRRRSSRPKQA